MLIGWGFPEMHKRFIVNVQSLGNSKKRKRKILFSSRAAWLFGSAVSHYVSTVCVCHASMPTWVRTSLVRRDHECFSVTLVYVKMQVILSKERHWFKDKINFLPNDVTTRLKAMRKGTNVWSGGAACTKRSVACASPYVDYHYIIVTF